MRKLEEVATLLHVADTARHWPALQPLVDLALNRLAEDAVEAAKELAEIRAKKAEEERLVAVKAAEEAKKQAEVEAKAVEPASAPRATPYYPPERRV